ncbi:MAG: hypothetical protein MUE95_12250 [Cyclobacteriaceae bacterium]|jgi:hypothetical protein|nr:hypothetical protein [Cyclobacteriaceae bacterium]
METIATPTEKVTLQPSLIGMHRESLEWLSATALWKRELVFFQNLLDQHAPKVNTVEFKKEIDHYQNLITYYDGELVDVLHKKLRKHESRLAAILQEPKESDVEYYTEHNGLMEEASAFQKVFTEFKHGFFTFIEDGFTLK